ncbi:hypothetical protein VTO73DRAFT_11243 [Trametes versicolor]
MNSSFNFDFMANVAGPSSSRISHLSPTQAASQVGKDSPRPFKFPNLVEEGGLPQVNMCSVSSAWLDSQDSYKGCASLPYGLEQPGMQSDASGGMLQSLAFDFAGSKFSYGKQQTATGSLWNESRGGAYWAGNGGLEAPSFGLHEGFDTAAEYFPQEASGSEFDQKCADLSPLSYTYEYGFLPAEDAARVDDPFFFPASAANRTARLPVAYPFDIALPTAMSIPLPDLEPSGVYEDESVPAMTAPQAINPPEMLSAMGGPKRYHAEDEDASDAPRPAKKARTLRAETRTTSTRPATAKRVKSRARKPIAAARHASPVAGPSNIPRTAAEETNVIEDPDDHPGHTSQGTEAMEGRTKRDRRTKAQVAAVTRTDLQTVPCPVEGCETRFDPLTHDANRDHLKGHYAEGALDAKASLPCLWTDCEARPAGTRLITHLHEKHRGSTGTPGEEAQRLAVIVRRRNQPLPGSMFLIMVAR